MSSPDRGSSAARMLRVHGALAGSRWMVTPPFDPSMIRGSPVRLGAAAIESAAGAGVCLDLRLEESNDGKSWAEVSRTTAPPSLDLGGEGVVNLDDGDGFPRVQAVLLGGTLTLWAIGPESA